MAVSDGALAATEMERYAAAMQTKTGLHPEFTVSEKKTAEEQPSPKKETDSGELFSNDIKAQLDTVFSRMANPLTLKVYLDERPVSAELRAYMEAMAARTDKLSLEIAEDSSVTALPCVRVYKNNEWTGLAFHGVPGGHEFTSFVLGLYNAAGPGQAIGDAEKHDIAAIDREVNMQILVSLSCTMCPELVTAAQRIAAENENITAQIYDLNHFPALRDRYNVMSVPCLIVGDGQTVSFGKKNIRQLLELLKG